MVMTMVMTMVIPIPMYVAVACWCTCERLSHRTKTARNLLWVLASNQLDCKVIISKVITTNRSALQ